MGSLVKDPAALARLAQSGEARQLVSLLKQSGGMQEAARAAADGDPGQLVQNDAAPAEHPGRRRAGGAHQLARPRVRACPD
ncbi:MAG: hypothetical protein ACLUJG_11600 [Lawsonibacter sp.]